MPQAEISSISPFRIVNHLPSLLSFYRDRLGLEITFQGPSPDDIFFGIVRRGGAQIVIKAVGVPPVSNYTRDIRQGFAIKYYPESAERHEDENKQLVYKPADKL